MSEISVLGNLRVAGSVILDKDNTEFPLNPKRGTLAIKGTNLFAYLLIGGMETWYPLFQTTANAFVHTQAVPSLRWVIDHQLNSSDYWYQVRDSLGNIIYEASRDEISANSFALNFSEAIAGTVLVVGASSITLSSINASLIQLGANVVINTAGMTINGLPVLTSATIGTTVNTAVTEAMTTVASDYTAAIAAAIATEVTDRNAAIATEIGLEVTARDAAIGAHVATEVSDRNAAISTSIGNVIGGAPTDGDTLGKLRTLISGLQSLVSSTDVNLDTVQEIVTALKADETLLASVTTSKVNVADVVNNLTSTSATAPLAAAQGKALSDAIATLISSGTVFKATKLATARNIALTGDVTGTASFDGGSDITITATGVKAAKLSTARAITLAGDLSGTVSFDGDADVTLTATLKGEVVNALGNVSGAVAVNFGTGSYAALTTTGATTLSLTGVPDSVRAYGLILEITNGGTFVTWPVSITWLAGTAPVLKAAGINLISLVTHDGGTTWLGTAT